MNKQPREITQKITLETIYAILMEVKTDVGRLTTIVIDGDVQLNATSLVHDNKESKRVVQEVSQNLTVAKANNANKIINDLVDQKQIYKKIETVDNLEDNGAVEIIKNVRALIIVNTVLGSGFGITLIGLLAKYFKLF
jgi:hypothetical protein